jgi:hypothetical protein
LWRLWIFYHLKILGAVRLTEAACLTINGLEEGLYRLELELHTQAGDPVAREVELFFVEDEGRAI